MSTRPGKRRRDTQNCRRKIAYETLKDAKKHAKLVRYLINELVLAYRCPLIRTHFHIGHPQDYNGLSWNDLRSGKYEDKE